jgi:hypothetical protein
MSKIFLSILIICLTSKFVISNPLVTINSGESEIQEDVI